MSKPPLLDTSVLAPCNHKEAESLIMLHATHAAHNGHKKILICTVDTELVVLVVALAHTLKEKTEVWVSFGTGRLSTSWQLMKLLGLSTPRKLRHCQCFTL